jgi:hypothetical protein
MCIMIFSVQICEKEKCGIEITEQFCGIDSRFVIN